MQWTIITLTDESKKMLNLSECIDIKPNTDKPDDWTDFTDVVGVVHIAKITYPQVQARLRPLLSVGIDLSGNPV